MSLTAEAVTSETRRLVELSRWIDRYLQYVASLAESGALSDDLTDAAADARRELTREDPMLFALVYMKHHLLDQSGQLTLSPFHAQLCRLALRWANPHPLPNEIRDAVIAPREAGKSTWLFLLLPMWAAAHEHVGYIAAFADSASQAQQHLASFRDELDGNEILGYDFPELCKPYTRAGSDQPVTDNVAMIRQANGLVFTARGIDSKVLGAKTGSKRPELLILDDIEGDESNYSVAQAIKRLVTLKDKVFPLNHAARVMISGTVTIPDGLIHQLVQTVDNPEAEGAEWVAEEAIDVHYFPALYQDDDGQWLSIWPDKWPATWLLRQLCLYCKAECNGDPQSPTGRNSITKRWRDLHISGEAHVNGAPGKVVDVLTTRSFRKNFQNAPIAAGGDYWDTDDIVYGDLDAYGRTVLQVDPAVTDKPTSDYYGFAVTSRSARNEPWQVWVRHASHARLSPVAARSKLLALLEEYPDIGQIRVESNQGGDLWKQIFHNMPVPVRTNHSGEPKPVRLARAHQDYQAGRVQHTDVFPQAENEMLSYPNVLHDDTVDAVGLGVLYFLDRDRQRRARRHRPKRTRQSTYLRAV